MKLKTNAPISHTAENAIASVKRIASPRLSRRSMICALVGGRGSTWSSAMTLDIGVSFRPFCNPKNLSVKQKCFESNTAPPGRLLAVASRAQAAALADGPAAELGAHLVHRVLGLGLLGARAVDEVVGVAFAGCADVVQARAEQAERGAVGLALQHLARDAEDAVGELCRRVEREAACADLEVRCLELERYRASAELHRLGARRDALALPPQDRLELLEA